MTTLFDQKRRKAVQGGSQAKLLKRTNNANRTERDALEVKQRAEAGKLTDECNVLSAELTCGIKDEIARKKMEVQTLEAQCKDLEEKAEQNKNIKLDALKQVHDDQLLILISTQVADVKKKLPGATKCKDCKNLMSAELESLHCHMGDQCAMLQSGYRLGDLCSECAELDTCPECKHILCKFEQKQECDDCEYWECGKCAHFPVGAGEGGCARMWTSCAGEENSCNKTLCKECADSKCAYGCTFCAECGPTIWRCSCGGCAICNLDGEKCCSTPGF